MKEITDSTPSSVATILPPGPDSDFLAEYLPQLQRDWLGFLRRCANRYGDIVYLNLPGMPLCLINNPNYIEDILVKDNRNFIKDVALRSQTAVYGNGLLTSEGSFWLKQRRLIQPAFHRNRIREYSHTMVTYTERLLSTWQDGETRDICQDATRLTLEILATTLFGLTVTTDDPIFRDLIMASMTSINRLDMFVYDVIRQRRTTPGTSNDLLSTLVAARYEDNTSMSDQQIRDEVVTLLSAGHGTTSFALAWACDLLSRHNAVEARLNNELQTALERRAPAITDGSQLPYLNMVIQETMRLYPSSWGFGREAMQDYIVHDYCIPKGTTVFMSQWVTHRDGRYFKDPDEFRPERWSGFETVQQAKFAYFPFGGGPRQCIGNAYALTEITLILAMIIQRYHLTPAAGLPVRPVPALSLEPSNGVKVLVTRRQSQTG